MEKIWRIRCNVGYGPCDVAMRDSDLQDVVDHHVHDASVGFGFGSITRSIRRAARRVEHTVTHPAQVVRDVVRHPTHLLTRYNPMAASVRAVVPKHTYRSIERAAQHTARSAFHAARNIAKSDEFAAALTAASFAVPALAPAAAAVIAAQKLQHQIHAGTKAAEEIARIGHVTPQLAHALHVGRVARHNAHQVIAGAQQGNRSAQELVGALRMFR